MIRRIKELAASLHDEIADDFRAVHDEPEPLDEEVVEDANLDVLVKHAVKSSLQQPDAGRVWKRLSQRVTGPYGSLAVEGPALRGQEMPNYEQHDQLDQHPESMRHSIFRLADSTLNMR
jgi:hypothetical protein